MRFGLSGNRITGQQRHLRGHRQAQRQAVPGRIGIRHYSRLSCAFVYSLLRKVNPK